MSGTDHQDRLDRATSARLSKLAGRSVDTRSLEEWAEQTLQGRVMGEVARPVFWKLWWRPTSAAAAILILAVTGWLVLSNSATSALAAPTELARIHFDVANGLAPHLRASTVEEANRLLAAQANGALEVPELPGNIKSCCLHQHAATTLTCVLIERDGALMTVAIADGAALRTPEGQPISRGEREFTAHTVNGINMVMAHEGNRWLCVMGEAAMDVLVEVAKGIRF